MRSTFVRRTSRLLLGASLLCALPALAWQPEKNVEIVIAGGPGGGTDQLGRLIQSIITTHKLLDVNTVVLNKGGRVTPDMLPPEIIGGQIGLASDSLSAIMGVPLREARVSFEREYLAIQIRRFSGNISKTASFIGMERSALHRKLKLLGMADRRDDEE